MDSYKELIKIFNSLTEESKEDVMEYIRLLKLKRYEKSNSSVFDNLQGFISNELTYVYPDVNIKIYFEQIFGKLIFKL